MGSRRGSSVAQLLMAVVGAVSLAGCPFIEDAGYVEIKLAPAEAATALYLNSRRLKRLNKGTAVLRENVGTAELATEGNEGRLIVLCDIEVRKDRITAVTISVLDRPPRCQCQNSISNTDAARVRPYCVG